jgi:hypothetical protein
VNLPQQPSPSRPLTATAVAVMILLVLLATVVAFLRGPRIAAGAIGVGMAAAALRLLIAARIRASGGGTPSGARPILLLGGGLLILAGSLSWPELSGLVASEATGARAATADRAVLIAPTPSARAPRPSTPMPSAAPPGTAILPSPVERPAFLRPDHLRASATSKPGVEASGRRVSYGVAKLVDGDLTTAWRVAGDGVGTTIEAEWDEPVVLSSIGVVPGYAKVDPADHTDRFHQERRVVAVRCSFDDDPAVTVTFADLAQLQAVAVDVTTRKVTIQITQTTAPPERDFTAISELAFQGRPA